MTIHCHQVNLQTGWGGGEVYTVFFTRALLALGIPTTLYVHPDNQGWHQHLPPGVQVCPVDAQTLRQTLAAPEVRWVLSHSPLAVEALAALRAPGRLLSCIAHMPLYGRNPARLAAHDYVIGVSGHVIESLRAAGITQFHAEPLLGIADLRDDPAARQVLPILRRSCYDWDLRKGRDRFLSWVYPFYERCRTSETYRKREGLTLGIVSRLTPIKQFPLLFGLLAPILARHPSVNLEIFGAGGYASVRDLRRVLQPLGARVRFWGHQHNVRQVYAGLDYLLTGLPEKEALGLNVIEAQACGTPVLAVDAQPFTETVAGEVSGLFYTDPRQDGGKGFECLIERLLETPFLIDPARLAIHLEKFSESSFQARIARLLAAVRSKLEGPA